MRILEQYKKYGYFWLPTNESRKIPGILTISDGGTIELEVIGLFDENVEIELNRIIGHVEDDGLITLEKCFYRRYNYQLGGIYKSLVHVNYVLSGVAYDKDEKITFNTACFSVEGLDEWLAITGTTISRDNESKITTIRYTPQNEIIYNLKNGLKLHIYFIYTCPTSPNITENKIIQKAYFKISSDEAKELLDFITLMSQITYLICLAVDETVTIHDVSVRSNEIVTEFPNGKKRLIPIKLYYPSKPFSENIPRVRIDRMLFRFQQVSENTESIINRWLEAYEIIKPALGLYFSAVTETHKYLDGKFLALAQGLETYHRRTSSETVMEQEEFERIKNLLLRSVPEEHKDWLEGRLMHGNEINLRRRIKKIIEPYSSYIGNNEDRNKIIQGIVNTRNYLTHYSEELEKKSVKDNDLAILCQKMEAIFQLLFLQQLGFTKPQIQEMLTSNYKLQQKFNEL